MKRSDRKTRSNREESKVFGEERSNTIDKDVAKVESDVLGPHVPDLESIRFIVALRTDDPDQVAEVRSRVRKRTSSETIALRGEVPKGVMTIRILTAKEYLQVREHCVRWSNGAVQDNGEIHWYPPIPFLDHPLLLKMYYASQARRILKTHRSLSRGKVSNLSNRKEEVEDDKEEVEKEVK